MLPFFLRYYRVGLATSPTKTPFGFVNGWCEPLLRTSCRIGGWEVAVVCESALAHTALLCLLGRGQRSEVTALGTCGQAFPMRNSLGL
ncbi:hypothetical protein AGOR_G00218010 [Albula goreensis]|uniref:Uncharacterized protein n=1 Tax=Albula goreensis TaxID=1534307 RepID=A0A8T3CRR1_9TELE|nr:hypothetical protein AGOR_G00218010 [Albula goreensis]